MALICAEESESGQASDSDTGNNLLVKHHDS